MLKDRSFERADGSDLVIGSFLNEEEDRILKSLPVISLMCKSCPLNPSPSYLVLPDLETFYLFFCIVEEKTSNVVYRRAE
jgi:hypothetical protein